MRSGSFLCNFRKRSPFGPRNPLTKALVSNIGGEPAQQGLHRPMEGIEGGGPIDRGAIAGLEGLLAEGAERSVVGGLIDRSQAIDHLLNHLAELILARSLGAEIISVAVK